VLKLRSVGRNKEKYTSVSGVAGTMFIKSKEMSEEMYEAMECRGFTGEYKRAKLNKPGLWDVLFILLVVLIILTYFWFDRL
jgi:cobalt/nickel transport system permease protein